MDELALRLETAVNELSAQVALLTAQVALLRGGTTVVTPSTGSLVFTGKLKLAAILGVDVGEVEVKFDQTWIESCLASLFGLFKHRRLVEIPQDDLVHCHPDGYLKKAGVKYLVNEFLKKRGSGETFVDAFVLFDPPNQQAWLVGTQNLIIHILENRKDKVSSEENISWILPKEDRDPISVMKETVDIGPMHDWYYSPSKFKGRSDLKAKILAL